MILLPNQLFFAEVINQTGIFLFCKAHPAVRTVLMTGDLRPIVLCGVILSRYCTALVVACRQVFAEAIILNSADLTQQRLVELFRRRPVISAPVED